MKTDPSTELDALKARLGFILTEIAYAHIHGWPRESQDRLVSMADAALAAARGDGPTLASDNDPEAPPWLLAGEQAQRIAYEHHVRAPAVQAIAKQVYAVFAAAKR